MSEKAFAVLLSRLVQVGRIVATLPTGRVVRAGQSVPEILVAISDDSLLRRLSLAPDLAFGEAQMDGTMNFEGDDLRARFP
jgi:cyclopropane-fatty-acyl-phospholipid synthase